MNIYHHYCKMGAFKSILFTKTLWLNDLTKSNDSQEVLRTYQNLWKRIKARLSETDIDPNLLALQFDMLETAFRSEIIADVPFGCCFCAENDLVHQWREYGGNGKGVAVGFDLDLIKNLPHEYPVKSRDMSRALGYGAVIYDSRQVEIESTEFCYSALKRYGNTAWSEIILPTFMRYSGFIKNPTFKDERETRIVFYPSGDFTNKTSALIEINTHNVTHYCLPWTDGVTSALKSVTIGYNNNIDENKIRGLLKKAGIKDDISIYRSECSYREKLHA